MLLFPSVQFCTFLFLQSLVGCIGNLGDRDQLDQNKPDDAKEGHHDRSDHQVPSQQEEEETGDHQAVADEKDEETSLAPRVLHLPVFRPKAAPCQEILLCLYVVLT